MKKSLLLPFLLVGMAGLAAAQSTVQTLPAGFTTTPGGNANSWPWANTQTGGHRCMWVYDSSHINFSGPVLISRLRWRASSQTGTWTGGTHPNVTIAMSTCPVDYAAASATYASNHGPNKTTVFSGTATVTPSTAGWWYVDIQLKVPFQYDPTQGDLTIDYVRTGGTVGGFYSCDHVNTNPMATRIQSYNTATSPTGSLTVNTYAIVTEITWIPAKGLYAGFSATPTIGSGPLTVKFTDQTFSSAAGGVTKWAWDFNGDNVVDSTVQNPTFIYPSINKTATYDVTLTASDGVHPASTLTKKAYITVDPPPVADFDATPRSGAVRPGLPPLLVKFTDKSIGAKTWAWDLNGDNVVDSTVQNPSYPYLKGGAYDITLSVTGVGGSDKVTKKGFIVVNDKQIQTTTFAGGNGGSSGWVNYFDVDILNAGGIWITALDVNASTYNVALTLDVYTTPATYVGKETNPSAWTLVATGTGTTAAAANLPTRVDIGNVFLPKGKYGIAIHYKGAGMSYTNGTGTGPGGNQFYSNTDFTLTAGASNSSTVTAPFTGTSTFTPRVWNGTIYYATRGWGDLGTYGMGCKGSNGVPTLAAASTSTAGVGKTVKMDLANMPVAGGAVLVLNGFNKTKLLGTIPLPWDISGLGAPGCYVLTDITFTLGAANVGGTGSFNLAIPSDPALLFGSVFSQAAILDPTGNTLGATFTNGAEMIIGS